MNKHVITMLGLGGSFLLIGAVLYTPLGVFLFHKAPLVFKFFLPALILIASVFHISAIFGFTCQTN